MAGEMQLEEIQTRVDDYLDDQIQTAADLESVTGLMARVTEQHEILKEQLREVQAALAIVQQDADNQAQELQQRATQFQNRQADIDRRLQEIADTDDSDEAVKLFESRMIKLRRIEVATGYLELFQEVDALSVQAKRDLTENPRAALASYVRLRELADRLQQAQPEAEGAAPHLVDQVDQTTTKLKNEINAGLVADFQSTLGKMTWPQKELNMLGGTLATWSEQASLLLELREPDLLAAQGQDQSTVKSTDRVLLPLEVMVQPLAQRFRYHFFGDKPTNRLDKPEYFLQHVLDLVDRHSSFMVDHLQPLIDKRVRHSDELDLVYSDAISEFITALLPIAMSKCLSILPQISSQPQLLSHFMHELMSFDNNLRESWAYNPTPGDVAEWRGLTYEILIIHDYFSTWLSVEKEFALSRYRDIRDAADGTNIDYDGVEPHATKPTKGAIRVNDLLETITDRYRGLSSFSQKMNFLIEIQLSVFDDYHQHLHGALQAYLASSHTAGRLLQGQSKIEALGEKGLATLCKIYGSAEFLERKMEDWGDDVFFLELWEELQDRAAADRGSSGRIGTGLSVDEVAAKTSSTIKQASELETEGGALFDETATSYRRLKELADSEILRLLDVNVRDAIIPLSSVETWASLSTPTTDISILSPSSALDGLLQTISTLLGFLRQVMAPAPLRKAARHFCSTIQTELISNVILRHTFSAAGVFQLKRDLIALENAIDTAVSARGVAENALRKTSQAVELLGLPIKATGKTALSGEEDEWGFGDEDGDEADTGNGDVDMDVRDDSRAWSLWEAEKALFRSNEAARQALSEMGLDLLSENEARNVLKRRVEIGS